MLCRCRCARRPYERCVDAQARRTRPRSFDWNDGTGGVLAEGCRGSRTELERAQSEAEKEHELGDLLFSKLGRWMGMDAEGALRKANARFYRRFALMERLSRERGLNFSEGKKRALVQVLRKKAPTRTRWTKSFEGRGPVAGSQGPSELRNQLIFIANPLPLSKSPPRVARLPMRLPSHLRLPATIHWCHSVIQTQLAKQHRASLGKLTCRRWSEVSFFSRLSTKILKRDAPAMCI